MVRHVRWISYTPATEEWIDGNESIDGTRHVGRHAHLPRSVQRVTGRVAACAGSLERGGASVGARATARRTRVSTWLRPWEDALQNGIIDDYPIFVGGPAESLKGYNLRRDAHAMSESFLGCLWDDLEKTAGVSKVKGRRWYGLRRLFRDMAANLEKDTRVLDRLMGHHTRGTGSIYEDQQEPWVRTRAMEVRELIWESLTHEQEQS